jgi:hypothetical protein
MPATATIDPAAPARNLFGSPEPGESFAGLEAPDSAAGHAALARIAAKIGRTRRPGAKSDIPAGATYLAQFVAHDLDLHARGQGSGRNLLDLALIYGDGPKHDAFCYQVPAVPGAPRYLLRVGRTRPTPRSPAWGALRDLPRTSCPHVDSRPVDTRSEVLVPNSLSDSNLMLGQIQVLWALTHNAAASRLAETRSPAAAFALAQRLTRAIYRDVVRNDLLGTWLMPRFRARYATRTPERLAGGDLATPREFMAGVGRLGHGLVREIYGLNDTIEVAGLRDLVRHTSTGRPREMPLTEDWLIDFSRFFAIGSSVPQRARAIGPHVARPFASGLGAAADGSEDGLVLRDLVACSRSGLRSVRSLISRARGVEPRLFEGCFAQDETAWKAALADWLADTGLAPAAIDRLAGDPPLTLFLMLEAEADTGGRTLGALGSVIMGEALTAALPAEDDDLALAAARSSVFGGPAPSSMAELIPFLQRRYRFPEGARLHSSEEAPGGAAPTPEIPGGDPAMLDIQAVARQPIARIEVADYIEMGRLVAQWATDPATRPASLAELKQQLDGIAVVPDRIRSFEFVESTLDHLVVRLPVKEMLEESLERVADPLDDGRYPLPQFYADHYRPGFGPVMTSLDLLLARVGDFTVAQCR